jgi:hypothetical protein
MLKAQYARFCKAWDNEKRYQQYTLAEGTAQIRTSDVKNPDGTYVQQIVEGDAVRNLLGRKPTFAMWLQAVKNKKINSDIHAAPPPADGVDPKKVQVEETDWE